MAFLPPGVTAPVELVSVSTRKVRRTLEQPDDPQLQVIPRREFRGTIALLMANSTSVPLGGHRCQAGQSSSTATSSARSGRTTATAGSTASSHPNCARFSEDLSFFVRVDAPAYVHTGIPTSHAEGGSICAKPPHRAQLPHLFLKRRIIRSQPMQRLAVDCFVTPDRNVVRRGDREADLYPSICAISTWISRPLTARAIASPTLRVRASAMARGFDGSASTLEAELVDLDRDAEDGSARPCPRCQHDPLTLGAGECQRHGSAFLSATSSAQESGPSLGLRRQRRTTSKRFRRRSAADAFATGRRATQP